MDLIHPSRLDVGQLTAADNTATVVTNGIGRDEHVLTFRNATSDQCADHIISIRLRVGKVLDLPVILPGYGDVNIAYAESCNLLAILTNPSRWKGRLDRNVLITNDQIKRVWGFVNNGTHNDCPPLKTTNLFGSVTIMLPSYSYKYYINESIVRYGMDLTLLRIYYNDKFKISSSSDHDAWRPIFLHTDSDIGDVPIRNGDIEIFITIDFSTIRVENPNQCAFILDREDKIFHTDRMIGFYRQHGLALHIRNQLSDADNHIVRHVLFLDGDNHRVFANINPDCTSGVLIWISILDLIPQSTSPAIVAGINTKFSICFHKYFLLSTEP
nr:MAG TPA: hypothetical protein [Caudoviricetes sp.]